MRRALIAATFAAALSVTPMSAYAQEPQPLPETACNEGTEDARTNAPQPADSGIPHENRTGHCHHAVPSGG